MSGSKFAESIASLDLTNREQKIYEQVALGNVPNFLRKLCPIHVDSLAFTWIPLTSPDGETHRLDKHRLISATYYVTPDYLAIGSDEDYFLTPLTPTTAQKIADLLHCSLPTKKMVDDIYTAAEVKLAPSPIPASRTMTTVPMFVQHNSIIREQRGEQLAAHPLGALVAGDKKDVVISNRLGEKPGRVAIYGWHKPDAVPIQPLTIVHKDTYADYSHGIRLIQLSMKVNGEPRLIPDILKDAGLCGLLSDEGPITDQKYPTVVSLLPLGENQTNRHEPQ